MVTFTHAQAALSRSATALATEATALGLTDLSTTLTNLSTELNQVVTEAEFFGEPSSNTVPVAVTWANVISAVASTLRTAYTGDITIQQTTIASEITTIDNHLDRLQSVIEDVNISDSSLPSSGSVFSSGPHVRNITVGWKESADYNNSDIARSLLVLNLNETNKLQDLKAELRNPTPLR